MADKINYTVTGLDNILGKLAQVNTEINYKGGRSALRKATQVLKEQAQANARILDDPETSEKIHENIDLRWNGRAFKRNGVLAFRLGVLGGARKYANTADNRRSGKTGRKYITAGSSANPGGDTWYWRFLELGTARQAAKPFLRPVANQAGQRAVDVFISAFNEAIDRAIRRQGNT